MASVRVLLKKQRFWIILFTALAILGAGFFLVLRTEKAGVSAEILLDGELIESIDLRAVVTPRDIRLEHHGGGYNLVRVEHGRISVVEADCPDQICVRQGAIEGGELPIVCLPHRLVIRIGGGG